MSKIRELCTCHDIFRSSVTLSAHYSCGNVRVVSLRAVFSEPEIGEFRCVVLRVERQGVKNLDDFFFFVLVNNITNCFYFFALSTKKSLVLTESNKMFEALKSR